MQTSKIQIFSKNLVKNPKKKEKNWLKFIIGGVIGFVNGIFGGGGGMICVPLLQKLLKMPPKIAHANTIAIIFPISFVSALIYTFNGVVKTSPLLTVVVGEIAGGIVGAFLLKLLPEKVISILFSLLMIFMGGRLLL